ncbi:MAG: hypothetical protein ABJ327_26175 [Litoreibacter sp.]
MSSLTPQIAEIVSFRLVPNTSDEAFLALAQESGEFSQNAPGFVSRQLSRGEDGTWTDLVVWDNLENAKAAQAAFPKQDFAARLMDAIHPDSLSFRHQPILWQQE